MNPHYHLALVVLLLGGCAVPPSRPAEPLRSAAPVAELYLDELSAVQGMNAEQARRELADLTVARRLTGAERFRLAVLAARDERGDWERALKTLDELPPNADLRAQALIEMLRKTLHGRLDLRQQSARAQELQDRIQQIKALEKDLQQRNEASKTP
jgi:hypothetical protein